MNISDKSTPLTESPDDTSSIQKLADNSAFVEPENDFDEPEEQAEQADVTEEDSEDNELIFGKFKTLEEAQKSYKEAERAITKAANLEKELRQYQEQSEKYEQDAIAQSKGFSDRLDMALEHDIRQHEVENYALAAKYTLPPQQQMEVVQLIEKCRYGGTKEDLALLRRYFNPDVVAMASEDATLYKNMRQADYQTMREQDKTMRHNRKLSEFKRLCSTWDSSAAKTDLVSQALAVTDGKINLFELKNLIEAVEMDAVKKHQTGNILSKENAQAQDSLQVLGSETVRTKAKKWLTREEYYNLTPKQEAEKYDLIVEQIKLEKQGLLPRRLTNL